MPWKGQRINNSRSVFNVKYLKYFIDFYCDYIKFMDMQVILLFSEDVNTEIDVSWEI